MTCTIRPRQNCRGLCYNIRMKQGGSRAESVVLYTTPDGAVKVKALVKNETLWLTQAAMAELFGVGSRVNEIEVLPGTLGGRIALATDPTGTTSICGSILLNGVPEVNGLAKEVS